MAKGAYDIGRKALYLVLVVIILIVAFTYIDVAIGNFRMKTTQHIGELEKIIVSQKFIQCVSAENEGGVQTREVSKERLDSVGACLNSESPLKAEIRGEGGDILWQVSFHDPKHTSWKRKSLVLFDDQLAVLEVSL